MLEVSTLLAWTHIGSGEFELIRRPEMTERQCVRQAVRIEGDRGARAWCFSEPEEPTWSPSHDRHFRGPVCANGACGWPLPGRRRV
jgi:hypothetical protein